MQNKRLVPSIQGAHWSGKSQGKKIFKVREKSGNSVKWSGKFENCQNVREK